MSCRKDGGCRGYRVPRERRDAVRKRLDFSEAGEPKPPPGNRYDNFKRASERHSSHEIIPPMYTSAEMAAVPDSFLEMFQSRIEPGTPAPQIQRSPVAPSTIKDPYDLPIPDSFLEFCQARIAERSSPAARSPSIKSPCQSPAQASYYVQEPSPYGTSYYGHTMPGAKPGLVFSPKHSSTMREASPVPSRSPPSTCGGYSKAAYGSYVYPTRPTTSPAYGLPAKYCYAPATPVVTPPTPPDARFSAKSTYNSSLYDTISSGDLAETPRHRSRSRKSSKHSHRTISPGTPMAHSTPKGPSHNLLAPNVSENVSGSSILAARRRTCADTVDSEDFLQSTAGGGKCPGCPTLGVTPIQSTTSFESMSRGNKQNISKSIENELSAREAHERSQLEADLIRWQQARRKLVMNTANMGA